MGRVVHFEIHAADPERAVAFYSNVLGWTFQRWGEAPYWLITTGPDDQPGINGGLLERHGEIDGQAVIAYVCTVNVDSLDETLARGLEHGATLALEKHAVHGVGWLAYLKDTEGNIFGLMQRDEAAA